MMTEMTPLARAAMLLVRAAKPLMREEFLMMLMALTTLIAWR